MTVAEQAHVALADQHLAAGAGQGFAADQRVDLGAAEPLAGLVHLQRQDFDFSLGGLLVQARQDQRQEAHFAKVGEGDAKAPFGGRRVEAPGAVHGVLDPRQGFAKGRVQLIGQLAGLDAVPGAAEQAVVEQLAQPRQAVADRGLGDEQALGGQGHAAGFVEGDEGADQVQIDVAHAASWI